MFFVLVILIFNRFWWFLTDVCACFCLFLWLLSLFLQVFYCKSKIFFIILGDLYVKFLLVLF